MRRLTSQGAWFTHRGCSNLPRGLTQITPAILLRRQYDFVMMEVRAPVPIDLGADGFARAFGQAPVGVTHSLADHPLLSLDSIAELADRFPGRIERHLADQPLVVPGGAPELEGPPSETVRGIDSNGCWMVFWYIDQVPEYKQLLDDCLDHTELFLPASTGPAVQREAFLFLSAPDAVTPIHFDPEHNFLLQIRGQKTMHVCPFESAEAERRELDRYHAGGHRNLDVLPSADEPFVLDPGLGVYVPSFMPHWVQNGPAASISLSITFRTCASRRAERVHWTNARLRRVGLSPKSQGASPAGDRLKETAWIAVHFLKSRVGPLGRSLARARHARSPAT